MRKTIVVLALCALAFAACSKPQEPAKKPVEAAVPAEPPAPIPQSIADQVKSTDYAAVRIKKFPISVECWSYRAYTFYETIDRVKALGVKYLQAYPGQPLGNGDPKAVFDHAMSDDLMKAVRARLDAAGVSVIGYGVVDIGTTEATMRPVFEFARKMGFRVIGCEPQDDDFTLLEKLVKEYDVLIAIHNHPKPSKYAMPRTAFDHLQGRDERIGVCADTGHWMKENIVPVEALRLLQGRIHDLHLKDRTDFGKAESTVDVAWGSGMADVRSILAELTLQDYAGALTMEYENEAEVKTPDPAIRKSVDFVKSVTYYEDHTQLLGRHGEGYEKHGWNHYGPGHFELDAKTGVLKSQGGMGLLWYGPKKFKDFVLELDYKCAKKETNSGIFVRVPSVPVNDDYIYHSFEVQIYDAGTGIHATGAAYDAEAPKVDASKPAGEWNHFKITFKGKRLQVELNGQAVLDWQAEPRGKVRDLASEGYIGLQNHDSTSPVYFKNIFIKEL